LAADAVKERGLARAIGSDKANALSAAYGERDLIDSDHATETFMDSLGH
jgi:hypothetical protein